MAESIQELAMGGRIGEVGHGTEDVNSRNGGDWFDLVDGLVVS